MLAESPPPNPKARRQSSGRRLSGFHDLENFIDENDDDAERNKAAERLAEQAEKKAQKARSPLRGTPGHQRRLQMYQECISMTAENKVNEKNSWSLDFIDHMERMLDDPADGADETTNFQKASTTLDAGVKIYSYRVDSVYTETFKLMGGLSRNTKRVDEAAIEEGDEAAAETGDAPAEGEKAEKGKKGRKAAAEGERGWAHLEKNPEALNLKKIDYGFEIDPLFHRTSAKFDEGGAKGLLLHNLPVGVGCQVVFDSSDSQPASAAIEPPAAAKPIPRAALAELFPTDYADKHLASEFVALWAVHNPCPPAPKDALSDDDDDDEAAPEEPSPLGEALHLEADAPPLDPPADLGGFDDDDDWAPDVAAAARERALGGFEESEEGAAAFMTIDEIAADSAEVAEPMLPHAEVNQQALRLLQVGQRWAGPGHWKFKAAPVGAPSSDEPKRSRNAKAPFALDFGKRHEAARALEAAPLDTKGTLLSAATLARSKAASNTLPLDCRFSAEELRTLFERPQRSVAYQRRKRQTKAADESGAGRSSDGFGVDACEGGAGFETVFDDDDGPVGFDDVTEPYVEGSNEGAEVGEGEGAEAGGAFQMVDAPERVAKVDIGYAKVAKQVDIKGLKRNVWDLLCETGAGGGGKKKGEHEKKLESEVSFQEVVTRLDAKLPEAERKEVSFAYCFICLLHLANEEGLQISGTPDMHDLTVAQPTK